MSQAQIVEGGVVVNCIATDPSAVVASDGSKITWEGGEFDAPEGATLIMQNGAGIGWTLSGGILVAPAFVAPPAPPPPPLAHLLSALIAAAISTCDFVTGQINRTQTHAAAFFNAASILTGNGGSFPTTGPLVTKIDNFAALYGGSPTALATLSVALQGAALDNLTALSTLEGAAVAATTATQLATALSTFETSIAAVVSEINAALGPYPISSPPTISIVGINA